MIPRYSRNKIKEIWSPENKLKIWLEIEILACEAQQKLGLVPKSAIKTIRQKAKFQVERVDTIERELKVE